MDEKLLKNIYDFAGIAVTAVLSVCVLFTFVFKISSVSGDSMLPTLHHGNQVLITARDWSVASGDIVVVSQPNIMEKVLIKRVIATEGQTVTVDAAAHQVLVDGVVLNEPYVAEPILKQGAWHYPITVPQGCVFVMGDNRNHSTDSRDLEVGMIDTRYIVGEAFYRLGDTKLLTSGTE